MRKKLLSVLVFGALFTAVQAQNIEEPEFVGESTLVKADNSSIPLEKQLSQTRTVASTGLILSGIGKVRQQIQIEGCCANVKVNKNEEVKLIVRNIDNHSDPLSIIRVFKFEPKKKFRRAEMASVNNFGSSKTNNLGYVSFVGKKYGTSSYIIKLSAMEPGEYGVIVTNPNALDEKQTVVSTFAVTE